MTAVLSRLDNKLPPPVSAFQGIVGREPYPVADKAGEIIKRLITFGVTRFRALFKGSRSRSEVVATFLAVLELCKARRLLLAGTESDCHDGGWPRWGFLQDSGGAQLHRHLHPGGGRGGVYLGELLMKEGAPKWKSKN